MAPDRKEAYARAHSVDEGSLCSASATISLNTASLLSAINWPTLLASSLLLMILVFCGYAVCLFSLNK